MALMDNQNNVIYWDEVNWQWLPFVVIRSANGKSYFFLKHSNFSGYVTSRNEVVSFLLKEGYTLTPISNLGVSEVSLGCYLYEGRLYRRDKGAPLKNLSRLLSLISGKSLSNINNRIKGIGEIKSDSQVRLLLSRKGAVEFKGKLYNSYSKLAKEFDIHPSYVSRKLSEGLTLEEVISEHNNKWVDHLGNRYNILGDMLDYWGVHRRTYGDRLKRGWTLEEALTGNRKRGN